VPPVPPVPPVSLVSPVSLDAAGGQQRQRGANAAMWH